MYCLIGIDAQPEKIQAALFDLRGNLIQQTEICNQRIGEGKIWEVDMLQIWENTISAVRSLIRASAVLPEEIAAMGVTGSEGGLWAVDDEGKPVMNAITAKDGRGEEEVWEINVKTPGIGKLVHRNLGHPVDSGSTLILLRWLKKNKPLRYDAAKTVFFEKDWIRFQLTDHIATDHSDGSSAFFRFANNGIPTQLMTVLGLNDVVDKIPAVLSGDMPAGRLSKKAADLLGLLPGIPVGTGCVDRVAFCIGVGSYEKDQAIINLEDRVRICLGREKGACDPGRTGRYYLPHVRKEAAIEILSTDHGLFNIQWATQSFMAEKNPVKPPEKGTVFQTGRQQADRETDRNILSEISAVPQGANGVVYYPFSGEDYGNGFSAGSYFGIRPETSVDIMVRAVYESLGYAIRSCFEIGGTIEKVLLIGKDFSKEPFLPQLISDITGRDLHVSEGTAFAAKGAAMLAGVAAGYYEHIQDAIFQCCPDFEKIQSSPSAAYENNYRLFLELRRACASLWQLHKEAK